MLELEFWFSYWSSRFGSVIGAGGLVCVLEVEVGSDARDGGLVWVLVVLVWFVCWSWRFGLVAGAEGLVWLPEPKVWFN